MDSDGVALYNGSTKLAEFKTGSLTFYQGGNTAAKFEGNRIGFYNSGTEYMYIAGGIIYANNDMYIGSGKTVYVGDWRFNANGLTYYSGSSAALQFGKKSQAISSIPAGVFVEDSGGVQSICMRVTGPSGGNDLIYENDTGNNRVLRMNEDVIGKLGTSEYRWGTANIGTIYYSGMVQSSSRDIKHDIKPLESLGEKLDQLQPVTFVYDEDPEEKQRTGLIYEDTIDIMPEICTGDEGQKAINYVEMIPMLLKEIQDLRARVSELERRE